MFHPCLCKLNYPPDYHPAAARPTFLQFFATLSLGTRGFPRVHILSVDSDGTHRMNSYMSFRVGVGMCSVDVGAVEYFLLQWTHFIQEASQAKLLLF